MGEGKRTRRPRAELRELVLEAGAEMLIDLELTLGFERLNYTAVFQHLERTKDVRVTHASVHERIWPSQRHFQLDALQRVLDDSIFEAIDDVVEGIAAHVATLDLSTPADRRFASRDLMRIAMNLDWDAMVFGDDPTVRIYQMLRLSLATVRDDSSDSLAEVAEFARRLERRNLENFAQLMQAVMDQLGLRLRPDVGEHMGDEPLIELARMANSVAVGFLLGDRSLHDQWLMLPTGRDGELAQWRHSSWAVWCVLSSNFELAGDDIADRERSLSR